MINQDTPIVKRDTRKPGWFSIDNEFFRDGYAAEIGAQGVATYCAIVLHADLETQQCWPSYRKLQEVTGLSRTTIQKEATKLAAWGLIHIEPRVNKRGRTSHMYTVLDRSVWRLQAVIKQGKGVFVTKTLKRPSDIVEDSQEEASTGQDDSEGIAPNGSLDTRLAVRTLDGGSASSEPGSVQEAHLPRSQGGPKQHSGDNNQKELDLHQHHQKPGVDDVVGLSFSEAEWILEQRELTPSERSQIKRLLALKLLPVVVPEFNGAKRFVEKLDASQVERLGISLMWLSHPNEYGRGLHTPAGFVRSQVSDDEWEDLDDFDDMRFLWRSFCWHIVDILKGSVTRTQCQHWLLENFLSADFAQNLERAGLVFKKEEILTPVADDPPSSSVDDPPSSSVDEPPFEFPADWPW